MSNQICLCETPLFPNVSIDVLSSDGNAFAIMSIVRNVLSQIKTDKSEIESVLIDMRSSDYLHLLEVASEFVSLENVDEYIEMNS